MQNESSKDYSGPIKRSHSFSNLKVQAEKGWEWSGNLEGREENSQSGNRSGTHSFCSIISSGTVKENKRMASSLLGTANIENLAYEENGQNQEEANAINTMGSKCLERESII